MPHSPDRRTDRGGRPLDPGMVVSSRLTRSIQPAPAASQPPTLHSRLPRPIHERISHEALPGVHSRSPVRPFPSPVFPPNGTGDLRLYPRASHPAVTSDARRDRDRPMDTGLGSHLRTHSTSTLVDPLTVWDFVSHLLRPSCSRQGMGPSSRSAYQRLLDPDGVPVFRTRERRPGRAPPLPRNGGVHTAARGSTAATCRFPAASPPPQHHIPSPGPSVTRHHQGFTHVRPSGSFPDL